IGALQDARRCPGFVGTARDDGLVKQRHIRPAAALRDDDVLVRGGDLEAVVIRADARRNHSIYGVYGVSVFAAHEATIDELAQRPPLVRFERLTFMRVSALLAVGMRLQPTGRNPAHYATEFDDESGVDALCSCEHRVVVKPYHDR
ncbi:MAG: hypothetical protein ACRDTT_11340, partial [Pseudonocardiaceae bacterium]